MKFSPFPPPRILALIFALLVLVSLAFAIPSCLQQRRSQAAQNRVGTAQAEAAGTSAGEASRTQATVNVNEVASEALGRSNEKAIRDAQGSDAPVAAPARSATIASLCRRASYRDTERCRLLNAR